METKRTDYEMFEEYCDGWRDEFMSLIEKLFKRNAVYKQNLEETKKDTTKLFKGLMDSYHTVEKYHRLTDASNT